MEARIEEVVIMETQRVNSSKDQARWPRFSEIRWGAIFGGVIVGLATYMLLALLGVAAGLSAVEPQSSEPVGSVPTMTGIWTGISMLLGAFVGGYVAARMSGLRRRSDGMFHGFVAWGVTTLVLAYLMTTAIGSLLGGTFNVLGQGMQTATQAAAQVADQGAAPAAQQLADKAEQLTDQAVAAVQGGEVPQQAREVADKTVSALAAASWWLFIGLLLSLALGIWGGTLGARAGNLRGQAVAS